MLTIPRSPWPNLSQRLAGLMAPFSLLLIGLLLLQALPAQLPRPWVAPPAPALPLPATPAAPAYDLPAAFVGRPELAALRTANSATFDMGDGRYGVVSDILPLHYQAEDGSWQPINPAFEAVEGGWLNRANTLQTGVGERSSAAKITAGELGVGWEPQALALVGPAGEQQLAAPLATGAAPGLRSRDGARVRYRAGWSLAGLEEQWQTGRGTSEYTMRLAERPAASIADPRQLALTVRLHLLEGTRIMVGGAPAELPLETSAPLEFTGADGAALRLEPPYAYEQGDYTAGTAGSYALAQLDADTVELRVLLPWAWLGAPERQYPVIIDPRFLMTGSTQARTFVSRWVIDGGGGWKLADHGTLQGSWVGSWGRPNLEYYVSRLGVRFNLPVMPPGSAVTKAFVTMVPTGVNTGKVTLGNGVERSDISRAYLMGAVQAHAMVDDQWAFPSGANTPHPEFQPAALPTVGGSTMLFAASSPTEAFTRAQKLGVTWDVSALAAGWGLPADGTPKFNNNPGLMIRFGDEDCFFNYVPAMPGCGSFSFGPPPSTWEEHQAYLEEMHDLSTPAGPFVDYSSMTFGGMRLTVFYDAPTLQVNKPIRVVGGLHGADAHPYFHAGNKFILPGFATDRWQAIAARSFAPGFGTETPTEPGQRWTVPLTGAMELRLSNPGVSEVTDPVFILDQPTSKGVSFLALNGRASGSFGVGQNMWLDARNHYVGGGAAGYEVRLINQIGALSTQNVPFGQVSTFNLTFNSASPLSLIDLRMPQGSNTEVNVDIVSRIEGFQEYAGHFKPQIIFSEGRSRVVASEGPFSQGRDFPAPAMRPYNSVDTGSIHRGNSGIFTPQSNKFYALALAYNGPHITTVPDPVIPTVAGDDGAPNTEGAETSQSGAQSLSFNVKVTMVSCQAGSFPVGGGCQPVECPSPAGLPTYANYYETSGMALWSPTGLANTATQSGQTVAGTTVLNLADIDSSPAPLLGSDAINGTRQRPQVAILGGTVSFDNRTNPDTVTTSGGKVLLIDCSQSPIRYLHVYSGALERTALSQPLPSALGEPGAEAAPAEDLSPDALPFDLGPAAEPEAAPPGSDSLTGLRAKGANPLAGMNISPWAASDLVDLEGVGFYVIPGVGRAGGVATLNRFLPDQANGGGKTLRFAPRWSWEVTGWPSFAHTISALFGNPAPPEVASMTLSLSGPYQLDVTPVSNPEASRTFDAIRTFKGNITQRADLGGDSRQVVAVILSRDAARPSNPPASCPGGSCIDLRGPNDRPGFTDRVWEMPDVRTAAPVGTVTMSREGELWVYSKDHPAALQGFDEEFSFDAYRARVSVEEAPCEKGGPVVTVVRGEAGVSLPNIGGGAESPIQASFKLCDGELRTVHMEFSTPVGIPIGSSGLFLTGLQGTVDIKPDNTVVTLGVSFQAQPSGDGGIFKGTGTVVIDSAGLFEFQGTGEILGTVNAEGRIWVAWNKLDVGFDVGVSVGDWLEGSAYAHLWQGRGWDGRYTWLPNDSRLHFAGEISATLTIKEGAVVDWWELQLPPSDISFGVVVAFGEFCTNGSCTEYEWGIKGKFVILGYDVGLYYGFEEGLDFILGNDDHILIDQYGGGQGLRLANGEEAAVRAAVAQVDGTADESLAIGPEVEQILVGLGWQSGAPRLSLVRPDGVEITPANAAQHKAEFLSKPTSMMVGLRDPQPGQWKVRVSGLGPEGGENYKLLILSNKGAPGDDGAALAAGGGLSVAPAAGGKQRISWQVPADLAADSPASIDLYYRLAADSADNLHQGVPIMKRLPYAQGSYLWEPIGLVNGEYEIYAEVHDGVNDLPLSEISLPDDTCIPLNGPVPAARAFDEQRFPGTVELVAAQRVAVDDTTAPQTPAGLSVAVGANALLASWTPSSDLDVQSYRLRWGRPQAGGFTVTNEQIVTGRTSSSLRLAGVRNGFPYGVSIEALDANGNASPPSAPVFATPSGSAPAIPLAPRDLARTGGVLGGVKLSWLPGDSVVPAAYELTATRVDLGHAAKTRLETSATSATMTGLAIGGTYDFTARARNADGWYSAVGEPLRLVVSNGNDANGDGLPDDWAVVRQVSGTGAADDDGDGLTNLQEYQLGTDPRLQDSDDDGKSDAEEQAAGSDPLESSSSTGGYTQPRLALGADTLVFRVRPEAGLAAASEVRSVAWSNVGGGTLQLQAAASQPWISASVKGDQLEVGLRPGLKPGFYSGVVRLTQGGSDKLIGAPQCVRVKAWVYPEPGQAPDPARQLFLPVLFR